MTPPIEKLTENIYAIKVPDVIADPHFYRVNNESIMFKWKDVKHPLNPKDVVRVDYYKGDLKDYRWPEYLCTTNGATEEDAKSIVSFVQAYGYRNYLVEDYAGGSSPFDVWIPYSCKTALESLNSLLKSKNLTGNYALLINQNK